MVSPAASLAPSLTTILGVIKWKFEGLIAKVLERGALERVLAASPFNLIVRPFLILMSLDIGYLY
ncbi:hypothetical protein GCM10008083_20850 [Ulvibacter litoralis]|nr:hypothetical protein GCM10008083_20850 [Ulvibacter litoralis]